MLYSIYSTFFQIPPGRNELLPLSSTRPEESHFFQKKLDPGTNKSLIYLCGDFNIDLLKINVKELYATGYNCLVSAGFSPLISLPTRVTDHSATLRDNIIYSTEYRPISQTVFMLSMAINRAEHVCATVIIKHNYMLMCNHKFVINIMLCLLNSTGHI